MNKKNKVLVVDDSFLMRNAIVKMLENDHEFKCIDQAENGQVALDMVKLSDYNVILLDLEMPVMDGLEFMTRCKMYTDALIIAFSSQSTSGSVQVAKALHYGAYDVVAKPSAINNMALGMDKCREISNIINRSFGMEAA